MWTKESCVTFPNSNVIVPVFKRGIQSPSGYFDTEKIPYVSCVNNQTIVSDPILAFIDPATNQTVFQAKFSGDGRDMLSPGYVEVFNPVSNPSVQGISFQVISENNQLKVIQKVEPGTIYQTPPSKLQNLSMGANRGNGFVRLQWDANTEPDITAYEIYRKIDEFGTGRIKIGTVATNYFVDQEMLYAPSGGLVTTRYKIRAKDNQNLFSVFSDEVSNRSEPIYKINIEEITDFNLSQNYPNPFNPTTTISYQIKEAGFVTLKVYDILGNEVANLVNETQEKGSYSVTFDASNLSSGIYICSLRVKDFVQIRKMTLLR